MKEDSRQEALGNRKIRQVLCFIVYAFLSTLCISAEGQELKIPPRIGFLCKNAVEAMPNGGTLTLRSYASEAWLCLDIADSGEGIPEVMPIFEPAVTNKPQGSGLGLTIVREIVKQHRGTVSYTSQPGNGTTFHLKFPIQAGQTLERSARTVPASWQDEYENPYQTHPQAVQERKFREDL